MLVLSRKKNEKITIGKDIVLVVVEVQGDKVRLGIEAPTSIPVHRQEVADKIAAAAVVAAASPPPKLPPNPLAKQSA